MQKTMLPVNTLVYFEQNRFAPEQLSINVVPGMGVLEHGLLLIYPLIDVELSILSKFLLAIMDKCGIAKDAMIETAKLQNPGTPVINGVDRRSWSIFITLITYFVTHPDELLKIFSLYNQDADLVDKVLNEFYQESVESIDEIYQHLGLYNATKEDDRSGFLHG